MVGPSLSDSGRPYLQFKGAGEKVWLMPRDPVLRQTAVKMYAPYSRKGRVFKVLMRLGAVGEKVSIEEQKLAGLEQALATELGETTVRLAFYNPVLPDRRIILIMKPAGGVLAYARIAGSENARGVVEKEKRILDDLGAVASLKPHIPNPLAFFEHDGTTLLVTSAGPGPKGPTEWTQLHSDFSHKLHDAFKQELALSKTALWQHATSDLEKHRPHLSAKWLERYNKAMTKLEPYKDTVIPVSMAHRDFTPWNTHLGPDRLFAFDWEYARNGYVPNYDYFFFHFVISSNVNNNVSVERAKTWLPAAPIKAPVSNEVLFLAYLLDIATFYHHGLEKSDFEETDILRETGTLLDGIDEWFKD